MTDGPLVRRREAPQAVRGISAETGMRMGSEPGPALAEQSLAFILAAEREQAGTVCGERIGYLPGRQRKRRMDGRSIRVVQERKRARGLALGQQNLSEPDLGGSDLRVAGREPLTADLEGLAQ